MQKLERQALGETPFRFAAFALILGTLLAVAFDTAFPDHRGAVKLTKATMHTVCGGVIALVVVAHLAMTWRERGLRARWLRLADIVGLEAYLVLLWTSWR